MNISTPCAFCGRQDVPRRMGRTGCACLSCIGEAAKQAIAKEDAPAEMTLTASDRCLMCGNQIPSGALAASRRPYVLCHGCLIDALQDAAASSKDGRFVQVNF